MTTCGVCKFTMGQEGGSLTCQRYPQPHRVARSYWCGEWQPRPTEKPQEPRKGKGGLRAALPASAASED
jgi:hypothetical protein